MSKRAGALSVVDLSPQPPLLKGKPIYRYLTFITDPNLALYFASGANKGRRERVGVEYATFERIWRILEQSSSFEIDCMAY